MILIALILGWTALAVWIQLPLIVTALVGLSLGIIAGELDSWRNRSQP